MARHLVGRGQDLTGALGAGTSDGVVSLSPGGESTDPPELLVAAGRRGRGTRGQTTSHASSLEWFLAPTLLVKSDGHGRHLRRGAEPLAFDQPDRAALLGELHSATGRLLGP